jgi:hypothetical protein
MIARREFFERPWNAAFSPLGSGSMRWVHHNYLYLSQFPVLLNNVPSTPSKPTEQRKYMKKALITMTTLAVLGATAPGAHAGDREWAVAGKVLAGIGGGLLLAKALEPQPVYVSAPIYVTPAPIVVQQPAPVIVQQLPQQVVVQQVPRQIVVQQPVIVQPTPVVYASAPVVYPAPVYVRRVYAPPVVSFSFGHGHRHHHRFHRHW